MIMETSTLTNHAEHWSIPAEHLSQSARDLYRLLIRSEVPAFLVGFAVHYVCGGFDPARKSEEKWA